MFLVSKWLSAITQPMFWLVLWWAYRSMEPGMLVFVVLVWSIEQAESLLSNRWPCCVSKSC